LISTLLELVIWGLYHNRGLIIGTIIIRISWNILRLYVPDNAAFNISYFYPYFLN